jgi:hypothetical protein
MWSVCVGPVPASGRRTLDAGIRTCLALSRGVFEITREKGLRSDFAGVGDDADGTQPRAGVFDGVSGELPAGFDGAGRRAGQTLAKSALNRGHGHPRAGRDPRHGQLGQPNHLHHEIPKPICPGPAVTAAALRFGEAEAGELLFEDVHLVRADLRAGSIPRQGVGTASSKRQDDQRWHGVDRH